MIKVIILGTGNVGMHLIQVFSEADEVELVQVYNRSKLGLKAINNKVDTTTSLKELKEADIYIIAITDDAISKFSSQLVIENKLLVHTSGSVSLDQLNSKNTKGVFYPLQTFSKETVVDFKNIPICIEAEKNDDLVILEKLASLISNQVYYIDSKQRKQIHLAAVFVNNFVNHLYKIGNDICAEHAIPKEILKPLIQETARKITTTIPFDAQTGPAIRNDLQTIKSHLALVSDTNKEIYKLLTQSIQQTYGEKL